MESLNRNQTTLSTTMQNLVNRCDMQFNDLTRRHAQLTRSIQDTTPILGPNLGYVNTTNGQVPNIQPVQQVNLPNFNQTSTFMLPQIQRNEVLNIKDLISNIHDITDNDMQTEFIWRECSRAENRIIPPYDAQSATLEKLIDSNDGWRDLAIRAMRKLKTLSKQQITTQTSSNRNVTNTGIAETNILSEGFNMLAQILKQCNDEVIKSISDEKNNKYFDKVKKPEELIVHALCGNINNIQTHCFCVEITPFNAGIQRTYIHTKGTCTNKGYVLCFRKVAQIDI
eukprot:GHVR01096347.1.p1 GENE.GHVR01096347.1~~GHVR01096347.1.p1  ORF type:complete len:283 (-),score=29.58 GHVR01096347.1:115-963(-)